MSNLIQFHEVWEKDIPYLTSRDIPEALATKFGFDDFDPGEEYPSQWYIERPEAERLVRIEQVLKDKGYSTHVIPYSEENSKALGWELWDGYVYGFKENPEMAAVANTLIDEDPYHSHLLPAKIAYFFRRGKPRPDEHGRFTLAYVQLANKMARYIGKWDFLMVTYEETWGILNEEQRKRLIDHELCHLSYRGGPGMVGHNIEEFKHLYEKYNVAPGEDIYFNKDSLVQAYLEQLEDEKKKNKED